MTEAEWLTCCVPEQLLDQLGTALSVRKARLFAVACCRSIWHLLDDGPARRAVEVSERLADGDATNSERRAAALATEGHRGTYYWAEAAASCAVGTLPPRILRLALQHATHGVSDAAVPRAPGQVLTNDQEATRARARDTESAIQAGLLRDIAGSPFRPPQFSPSWRTSTVVALAAQMYETRDFSTMPILGDALQDAACDNDEVLNHCRAQSVHVRGCWVVDLVLGKE